MTYELTPGLIDVGGILVENYQRESLADNSAKEALGLSLDITPKAGIGIAAVEEFLVLKTNLLPVGGEQTFLVIDYAKALQLVSLIVDAPKNKSIRLQVRGSRGASGILDQVFIRTQTPYHFPPFPLDDASTIKITAVDAEARVHLVCKLCVILPVPVANVIEGDA